MKKSNKRSGSGSKVTPTGRSVSGEPSIQNIPIRTEEGRKIREALVARRSGE